MLRKSINSRLLTAILTMRRARRLGILSPIFDTLARGVCKWFGGRLDVGKLCRCWRLNGLILRVSAKRPCDPNPIHSESPIKSDSRTALRTPMTIGILQSQADPATARSASRFFALDILRGLACMLVLVSHMPVDYQAISPMIGQSISFVCRFGWLGVDLFFVLSGLLISGLLFKEIQLTGKIDFKRFWLRRGFKIWPCYFIAFGLMVAAGMIHACTHGQWDKFHKYADNIVPNVFFFQNYKDSTVQWPHSWSIAIEEHFYLVLPFLLAGLLAIGRLRWLPGTIGLGCVAVLALRLSESHTPGNWAAIKYPTHFRADALLFGVLLGYSFAYFPQRLQKFRPFWPFAIIASTGMFITVSLVQLDDFPVVYAISFTVIYLAFGSLVLSARLFPDFGRSGSKILTAPMNVLAFVGVYSYTIYIAHGVIFKFAFTRGLLTLSQHPAWKPCMFVIGSIVSGILLSHAVERPFLKLREKWAPSGKKSPLVSAGAPTTAPPWKAAAPLPAKRAA
jgi:peptidoglycan/LPS O-acetylase OafA/YrhL